MREDAALRRFQRLPPDEGVADIDIHLLWSADRKFSAAETAFLDALNGVIDVQETPGGSPQ